MRVDYFGVRHHGPGCARALRNALEALQPDIVLVEGPPDAEPILPLLAHETMTPPVALLLYRPDAPRRAVFYPFTHFSPEWQALRYALERGIPARFMDLPQSFQLGAPDQHDEPDRGEELPAAADSGRPHRSGKAVRAAITATAGAAESATGYTSGMGHPAKTATAPGVNADSAARPATASPLSTQSGQVVSLEPALAVREDPLALLAEAAGFSDHEAWWEEQIEQRRDATGLFQGIREAMTALREDLSPRDEVEAQREAHMRQTIRASQEQGFERIAVVCGAWHVPALAQFASSTQDADLLRGLPRVKVASTWIPWTNSRLSYRSGYGAGINSPGWYSHLWEWQAGAALRWVTRAAHLLRDEGLDASSASVIEAVRLSEALAAIRGLSMPGIGELREAIQTVLCHGEVVPMALIRDKLEIGEAMGIVPFDTPAVPLQRDLEAQQRRLKLPAAPEIKQYDLDLRTDNDRARSRLLHRMRLLGIEWGKPQQVRGKTGTFHEVWHVQWHPEFAVKLIEASVWGNMIEAAADAFAIASADKTSDLPALTALLDAVFLAELPEAVQRLLERVQSVAAVAADVQRLMDALPPLTRIARYGDVRGTGTNRVMPVISALVARVIIGLPGACASLDDEAAAAMGQSVDGVHESISLLDHEEWRADWLDILSGLARRDSIHGLVRGRCCRILLEQHRIDEAELGRLAGLALSPAVPADAAAAWVEGVLHGSGLLLVHQDALWVALDAWLYALSPQTFVALLPLVRRGFSGFSAPERRAMGEKVKLLHTGTGITSRRAYPAAGDGLDDTVDAERASRVLPVLAQILGVSNDTHE